MIKFRPVKETLVNSIPEFKEAIDEGSLTRYVIQDLDLRNENVDWNNIDLTDTSFLGCRIDLETEAILRSKGAVIFPKNERIPYNPFRKSLYTWQELMEGYTEGSDHSLDLNIYDHFFDTRFNPGISEALHQRIHDHSIDNALRELLQFDEDGMTNKKCVGIMGGHGTPRTDEFYQKVVETSKLLTEAGYYVASGGGPGIMEAANLGAWLAGQDDSAIGKCIEILSEAPTYKDKGYIRSSRKVLGLFPKGQESLAIPTWFYGHEPSNLFATHIAKYFSNSIREDTLLAISLHGVIFAPGSAGTTQEIFMDAAQNHYGTFNYFSPMVFLSEKRYAIDTLIFPLLKQLSFGKEYYPMLKMTDEPQKILDFIQKHPPLKRA